MVLETAVLEVIPGREAAFERDFAVAQRIISTMGGYRGHELLRCVEARSRYLLLVRWDRIEDHREGFRKSPEYGRWKALLHPYYDPFPAVEYYEPVPGLS